MSSPTPDIAPPLHHPTYLLLGPPGSGKGTQGKILGTIPRFFHMACGEVFRRLDTRTPIGQEFIRYSSKGQLVPDDVTIRLWKEAIAIDIESHRFKPDIDCMVLDGIPRNPVQASLMEDLIDVKAILHLVCPDRPQLIQRLRKRALKENRFDDASDEVIARRLATYEAETAPVLARYPSHLIHEIDALNPPVKVLHDILGVIIGPTSRS